MILSAKASPIPGSIIRSAFDAELRSRSAVFVWAAAAFGAGFFVCAAPTVGTAHAVMRIKTSASRRERFMKDLLERAYAKWTTDLQGGVIFRPVSSSSR